MTAFEDEIPALSDDTFDRNIDFIESLSACMIPRYLLFLSADLVGSTSTKQRHKHWGMKPNVESLPDAQQYFPQDEWFFFLSEFYSKFRVIFKQELETVCEAYESYATEKNQRTPERSFEHLQNRVSRWKLLGDEVIFTVEIQRVIEVAIVSIAFRNALIVYRKVLYNDSKSFARGGAREDQYLAVRKERYRACTLDVKGTIWSAGFPISNREVVVDAPLMPETQDFFGEDPYQRNLFLLEESKAIPIGEPSPYLHDYVGPSIDTGFRLTGLANPRKLIISAEVAYLLCETGKFQLASMSKLDPLKGEIRLGFEGRQGLKGVVGGNAYPVFWIDSGSAEGLSVIEDALLPRNTGIELDVAREYLTRFFQRQYAYVRSPMILDPRAAFIANSLCRAIWTHNHWWKGVHAEMISRREIEVS